MPALVKSGNWPVPVVESLTALWDALDAADMEVSNAVREKGPADQALKQLEEDFDAARYQIAGVLLDALAPEPADVDSDAEEEEAMMASAGQVAASSELTGGPILGEFLPQAGEPLGQRSKPSTEKYGRIFNV
jgi:hypothetical protein